MIIVKKIVGKIIGVWCFFLLITNSTMASVRELVLSGPQMGAIYLKLGKSTVLRFNEKPKKVVVGNKNFFNVEFIENDLTIQSLGVVESNIFVYGENHTYGFNLNVTDQLLGKYDDLVIVKWRPIQTNVSRKNKNGEKDIRVKTIDLSLKGKFSLRFDRLKEYGDQGIKFLEGQLINVSKGKFETGPLDLKIIGDKGPIGKQALVIEKNELSPKESCRVRIFFNPLGLGDLKIDLKSPHGATFAVIPRKF